MENQAKTTASSLRPADTIDLLELFFVLLRRWWVILLVTIATSAAMFGYCVTTYVPHYTATAKMYVNNNSINIGASQVSITTSDISAAQSLVQTYSEILQTYLVLDQVSEDLAAQGYDGFSYENLSGMISCGALHETEIFYIRVQDTDPQRAIDIVNTIVDDLPAQIALVIEGSSARTVDRAKTAQLVNPGFERKISTAAILGLVLSCCMILFFDYFLNDTLSSPEWLTTTYGKVPILGQVPNANQESNNHYGKYYYYYFSDNAEKRKKHASGKREKASQGGVDRVS